MLIQREEFEDGETCVPTCLCLSSVLWRGARRAMWSVSSR